MSTFVKTVELFYVIGKYANLQNELVRKFSVSHTIFSQHSCPVQSDDKTQSWVDMLISSKSTVRDQLIRGQNAYPGNKIWSWLDVLICLISAI